MNEPHWVFLVVEDNALYREDIREEFDGEELAGREVTVQLIDDFDDACREVGDRRADLVILDVLEGDALKGGVRRGLDVFRKLRDAGFVHVIFYTAIPEEMQKHQGPFVHVVSKESGVLGLRKKVEEVFEGKLTHVFRAIVSHLDNTLRTYMWGFVADNWDTLAPISSRPEFLRLLLRRLAASLASDGIDRITADVFGLPDPSEGVAEDRAHPAEYYIVPPVPGDVRFGDIRRLSADGSNGEFRVVVWPSCDLVTSGGREAKTTHVTCALAVPLSDTPEMKIWESNRDDQGKRRMLANVMANKRGGKGISPERYHFLPGFYWIPGLVVDFQNVERVPLTELASANCVGTVASPFAEHLGARYLRYIGRLGVPDLDTEELINRLPQA